jgi:hypothetical protein
MPGRGGMDNRQGFGWLFDYSCRKWKVLLLDINIRVKIIVTFYPQ